MFTTQQVTALTAQTAVASAVSAYDVDGVLLPDWQLNDSNDPVYLGADIATRGVGVYGQSPAALTLTGFLKPGTIDTYLQDPADTLAVLLQSSVWTGLLGVTSLLDYLNFPLIQNLAQQALLQGSYQGLIDTGIITGDESARFQAAVVQPAAQYGVDAVIAWIVGVSPPDMIGKIQMAARQGQYAIDFVDAYSAQLNVAPTLSGYDNTVERQELDQLVSNIIGNAKIPNIIYSDAAAVLAVTPMLTDEDGIFRFAPDNPLRK